MKILLQSEVKGKLELGQRIKSNLLFKQRTICSVELKIVGRIDRNLQTRKQITYFHYKI